MSILAIIHPTTLLGQELREHLDQRTDLWHELRLLSPAEEEVGTLTETLGKAAVVQRLEFDALEGVDVVFFCGPIEETRPWVERAGKEAAVVILSPDAGADDGRPIVSGVNLDAMEGDGPVLSPQPAAILLAHLLYPLRNYEPREAVATILRPISTYNKAALDEVFEQSRAVLAFAANPPREIFPVQMPFNVIPLQGEPAPFEQILIDVLNQEEPPSVTVQSLQAGIFHGFSISLFVELQEDPGVDALRGALGHHPMNDLSVDPELLGPLDAAGREEVIIGGVSASADRPGGYWIWAVMDNLTRGGALNALEILEGLGASVVH